MQLYADQGQTAALHELAQDTLRLAPNDPTALANLSRGDNSGTQIALAASMAHTHPTAEAYLNLSLLYHHAGRYQECIDAAREALRLKPDYAEAYNNIAAAYQSMSMWDPAIDAAKHALRIDPNFQLAKNNLAWSTSQKNLQHH
jgi:tetratricopeptide (TPR) repeat protein